MLEILKSKGPTVLAGLLPLLLIGGGAWAFALVREDSYRQGQATGAAHCQADTEAARRERAEADRASAEQAAKTLQLEQARADRLASQLATQQREHRETTDRLSKEIDRVSRLYRKALDAPPEPVPACVFTRGWVRLYDQATGAGLPAAADPGGAAAPATEAEAADQLSAGIDQGHVLAHHLQYAEQCRNTAAQLDALIDLLEPRHDP